MDCKNWLKLERGRLWWLSWMQNGSNFDFSGIVLFDVIEVIVAWSVPVCGKFK